MEIKEITKKEDWDGFLLARNAPFSQSWDWGEVLLVEGKKIWRLGVVENGQILAAAQIMEVRLPLRFKYGFCPGGPVLSVGLAKEKKMQIYELLIGWARGAGQIFSRVEPDVVSGGIVLKKTRDVNPSTTLILELTGSQEKYWENLDRKTRYEINQAKKRGVNVKEEKNLDVFWSLMSEVSRHDDFITHPKIHYDKILASVSSRQLIAYHENEPVATAIFWQWGGTLTYLFAAASRRHGHLSASYLIQEQIIASARATGLHYYDFFGVAPRCHPRESGDPVVVPSVLDSRFRGNDTGKYTYDLHHRYAGFTKFKLGFGGKITERPGTYDLVISPWHYRLYNLQRTLRGLI